MIRHHPIVHEIQWQAAMHELWSSASYELHLLSLPFALPVAALLIVIAYAAVMRGAPVLRGYLLAQCSSLLPYSTVVMLSPSIRSEELAGWLFQIAGSFIPLVGATAIGFQMALLGRYRRYRRLLWLLLASGIVWVIAGCTAPIAIDGVTRRPGFWYPHAGPWAWLAVIHTLAMTVPGFTMLAHAALTSPPSEERRQLRAALVANLVVYSGLVDVSIAYGVKMYPVGWLLSGIGSLMVVRALIVEDLLRVRAVDTTAPLLVLYFATGTLLAWVAVTALSADLAAPIPWPLVALALIMCFAGVRVSVATIAMVNRGARGGDGPLDRLLAQLVGRARALSAAPAIAELAIDIIELALGVRVRVLLASEDDWGWSTQTGERLDDARAPDPLVASWLAERRDAVFADDVDAAPPELRDLLVQLFHDHAARALIPVGSADEVLGIVLVPAAGRRPRVRALGFLVRAAEGLAEALLHARLAGRAAERAALAREVELAATVQAELLPGKGPHVHGAVTVVGSWRPATRCAGDFWIVTPLGPLGPPGEPTPAGGDHRSVLVVIGDVTGHGVASAMVSAALIAACDVCVRRSGAGLDLGELITALDAAARRVGGGELAATCAAAILDPDRREIRFVSCGHAAPYLCRATDGATPAAPAAAPATAPAAAPAATPAATIDLHALVGRGNPLGSGQPAARVQRRPLHAGDLVVWYTDGVVEAQDPSGATFGDRRLQHLLKKLDRPRLTAAAVHDLVLRRVAAHRAGRPLADDETLVVAQLAREAAP
ncbi:MAG: serine/threonine-protein phosphatase [Deltaproteobacteria bacterium]|nr:MAG: serine/threonine-protein phosphatase [Deltaproteobacteria bacterium]